MQERRPDSTPLKVLIHCDGGDPTPSVARTRVACHEPDHFAIFHGFESDHVWKGQYGNQVEERPGVAVETFFFKFAKRVEVKDGSGDNFHKK
jgi:hypothetical protein